MNHRTLEGQATVFAVLSMVAVLVGTLGELAPTLAKVGTTPVATSIDASSAVRPHRSSSDTVIVQVASAASGTHFSTATVGVAITPLRSAATTSR